MIRSQRKAHFVIWMVWAILLPAGIITSICIIPREGVENKLLQPGAPEALAVAIDSIYNDYYKIVFRKNEQSDQLQLEFINKKELVNPSSLIYLDSAIVGRIENRGTYRFPVKFKTGDFHFELIDVIHNKKLDSWVFHM